jgi:ABC-2 type transport system ATP-binding protein
MHRPVGEYSKGMTRRLGLAQALINDPEFLILDEPTSGLDPIGTRQVKDLILELGRRGKTILLSSHLLADVEDVCDRIVILYGGKIRAQGTADELLADTDHTVIRTPRLEPETISRIEHVLEGENIGIESVQTPRQRLEELFMSIVEQARAEQIETSGAVHGGETAKFLRAEDGEREGEGLIDSLLREDEHHPAQVAAPAAAAAAAASEENVLSELLEDEDEAPVRAVEVGDVPEAPEGVDSDVIDTLLETDEKGREGGGA